MQKWIDDIEELLIDKLKPTTLILEDKTEKHINHPGHESGKNHLRIEIHSFLFHDKTKVEQHKMVLDLLKPHLQKNLHSISLVTNVSQD